MPSRIVTLTPGSGLGRLRPHIGADRLIEVATVAELAAALRDGAVRWVVVDPMALSEPGFDSAVEVTCAAGARVAFYSPFVGFDHNRLLRSLNRILPEIVFSETDDDWARLAQVVRRDVESVAARVLRNLGPPVRLLRERYRGGAIALFGALSIPPDVDALAARSGTQTGAMRAEYQRVGLSAPHDMLDIARLAYAYTDLADRGLTLQCVADRHGFDSGRALDRRTSKIIGLSPRKAVRECDPEEFAQRLSRAAIR